MPNPFARKNNPVGGSERSVTVTSEVDPLEHPSVVSVRQFLTVESTRLPTRADLLGEINVLRATKGLGLHNRERLADQVLEEREKKPEVI